MQSLSNLKPNQKRKSIRRGRGNGSNKGTFSGRGCNGQNARAGGGVRLGFEGGQSGLLDRMPKLRGFRNPNRVAAQTVSLAALENAYADGETVSVPTLVEKGLMLANNAKVKVLANGSIKKKLTVAAGILISAKAKEAIEKAGGKVAA